MTTFISPQALTVYDTVAPTGVAAYAWLLILIPLASAGLLLLLGHQLGERARQRVDLVGGQHGPVGQRRLVLAEQPLKAEQQ